MVDLDGEHDLLSLRDLMEKAHLLRDIAVTAPPAAAALMRLLYVIAARVTGLDRLAPPATANRPDVPEEWLTRRAKEAFVGHFRPDSVRQYFDRHAGRWDLFSRDAPWMQDPRLRGESKPIGVNRFDPTRPNDNSQVWFRHTHHDRATPIPTPQAILWLLMHHQYGAGGGGGTRTVETTTADGSVRRVSDQYMSSGPLRAILTFYPLGHTLFESLIAGLPDPTSPPEAGEDAAPWERTELSDPLAPPPQMTAPAGLLIGRSRHALLLHPDVTGDNVVDARLTWGFKEPHPTVLRHDPYVIVDRGNGEGEWYPRRTNADRALWRDLDALLADSDRHLRPEIIRTMRSLPSHIRDELVVRAYGVDQDRQATDKQWITATTPTLFGWLFEEDPTKFRGAELLRTAADTVAGSLRFTLKQGYRSLAVAGSRPDKKDVPWVTSAMAHYWPHAQDLFWDRFLDEDFTEPHRAYTTIAVDALRFATDHEAHHTAVARAQADMTRFLHRAAAKKEPRTDRTPT